MPLEDINLDDRRFEDLVAEALNLIPIYAPEWSNHNPSDPGIMLLELLAYLTEIQVYRLNLITEDTVRSYLKLLNGSEWKPSGNDSNALATDIQNTIVSVRKMERAVTRADYEFLARQADNRVARAFCVPNVDLSSSRNKAERDGHVSLVILPKQEEFPNLADILRKVQRDLDMRRLLGTHLHVVGPQYVGVKLDLTIIPLEDSIEETVKKRVSESLVRFFDPLHGGKSGSGWPFGRSVFASEIYALVDQVPGVDAVSNLKVTLKTPDLRPYELLDVENMIIQVDIGSRTTPGF